jgi:cyclophilin family peptidyl-prolyl cis-trans isomerase
VISAALLLPALLPAACKRAASGGGGGDAGALGALASSAGPGSSGAPAASPEALASARRAADRRIAGAVLASLASADPPGRRAFARALAQIADAEALPALRRALSDADPEVVAWAAHGVAAACDRDATLPRALRSAAVAALAARALTLEPPSATSSEAGAGAGTLDPWESIAWGLGRCGGSEAAQTLAPWLATNDRRARLAALALGAIAERDHGLEDDVVAKLLAAAQGAPPADAGTPAVAAARPKLVEALYPFGRGEWRGRPPPPHLAEIARAHLANAAPGRMFAIRAYGRAEGAKVDDLRGFLVAEVLPAERVEALRALHRLGPAGDAEIAAFVSRNAPAVDGAGDATKLATVTGPLFGALLTAIELLGESPLSPTTKTSLGALIPAGEVPIVTTSPPVARRTALLRCAAAAAVHRGAPGDPDILRCAAHPAATEAKLAARLDRIRDDARLQALDAAWLASDKRELAVRLAREGVPAVRERALVMLGKHAEAGELPELIAKALGAKEPGVVAAAAEALEGRPSIANRAKKKLERAREDDAPPMPTPPSPPSPSAPSSADAGVDATAAQGASDAGPPPPPPLDLDPTVLAALDGALARPFEEADDEVRLSLAAAVGALRHEKGRGFLARMCEGRGYAQRAAARRALDALDPASASAGPPRCEVPTDVRPASPLADAPGAARTTVRFETDAGTLDLELDPTWSPIAVARIVELVRSGFYDGIVFHRVVPGFVVQLGDPGGDGYGGASPSLRCETAPIPFARGDVGLALAGRDTGSSQIFVTLAPAPRLDGSYPWLGRAKGDASAIAEGDVVVKATIVP